MNVGDINHRFYKAEIPKIGDLVIVKIKKIDEVIIETELREYNNISGTLLVSEVSRKNLKNKNKKLRIGNLECVKITSIDTEKKYIDLTKHNISENEEKKCVKNFKKQKLLFDIVSRVSSITNIQLNIFYETLIWKISNIYDFIVKDDFSFLDDMDNNFPKNEFIDTCHRKIIQINHDIKAIVEVNCFEFEGIDSIKKALKAGEATHPDIKIKLITSPQFEISITTNNKVNGIEIVDIAIKTIEKSIKELKGEFKLVQEPYVLNELKEEDAEEEDDIEEEELEEEELEEDLEEYSE